MLGSIVTFVWLVLAVPCTCFLSDTAVVTVASHKSSKRLASELKVGDLVQVGGSFFEPVLFVFPTAQAKHPVVEITWSSSSIILSTRHNVYVEREKVLERVSAESVLVGDDLLLADGGRATVERVERKGVETRGFTPITPSESIAVNGIIVSTRGRVESEFSGLFREMGITASEAFRKYAPEAWFTMYSRWVVGTFWPRFVNFLKGFNVHIE